jgi:hypothetical protein
MRDLIFVSTFTHSNHAQKFKSKDCDLCSYRKQWLTGESVARSDLGKVTYHSKQCTIGSRQKGVYRWSDLGIDSSVVAAQLGDESTKFRAHSIYLTTYRSSE